MSNFIEDKEMPILRGMIIELLEVEHGLTDWEIEFLENLNQWKGNLTVNQADRLEKIYKKVL